MNGSSSPDPALAQYVERYSPLLERWVQLRMPKSLLETIDVNELVRAALAESVLDCTEAGATPTEATFLARARQNVRDRLARAIRPPTSIEAPPTAGGREPDWEPDVGSSLLDRYDAALAHLGRADRDAIILRIELGLPWADLTTLLNKPSAPAARIAVSRALVRLAREMAV